MASLISDLESTQLAKCPTVKHPLLSNHLTVSSCTPLRSTRMVLSPVSILLDDDIVAAKERGVLQRASLKSLGRKAYSRISSLQLPGALINPVGVVIMEETTHDMNNQLSEDMFGPN